MDEQLLRALAKLEPKRVPHVANGGRVTGGKPPFLDGKPVWVIKCFPDDEETRNEERRKAVLGKGLTEEHLLDSERVDWLNACGVDVKEAVRESDWIFFWWKAGRSRKFGRLEGPYEALGGFDLGRAFGDRRYCMAFVRRRPRRVTIDTGVMDRLFRIVNLGRPKRREDGWEKLGKKPRRVQSQRVAALARLVSKRT